MADRLCRYCEDRGDSCCSRWCYVEERWVFIGCDHRPCRTKWKADVRNPRRERA